MSSLARPQPHDAARLHVTGQARYVDDIPTPAGALHLAFGLSEVAHGVLRGIDLSEVRNCPGVIDVLTAADLPFDNDVSPSAHDEPLLATDRVHYVGQPVFLVIADSHLTARRAARKGQLAIDPLPAILTVDQAITANSRFEEGPRVYEKGDAKAAIADAVHRLKGTIEVGGQEHFYLEGQAAMALPQDGGDMVIHSSTQHPTEIQHKVAEAVGLPMHAVRVEMRRMGGGFGGKESQGNALAVACAIAARHTGRACKMRYDRDDDMVITGKRHDIRIDYDVGFDETGRVAGLNFVHKLRCGWAMDLSLPVADRAMLHADNAYHLPTCRIESHRLKTNTQSATAFRGFGGPQGMVGIERVMDHIAHHLGRDPLAVRQANYYSEAGGPSAPPSPPESISAKMKTEAVQTTPYFMEVEDFELHAITARLADQAGYAARRAAVAAWNADNAVVKRGVALTPVKFGISFTLTHLNQAGALVHVYSDGSIQVNHGGTEMGQGLFQKMAQVADASFGCGIERIKVTATDTSKVPNTSATAASSGSDLNGMAVRAACEAIKARMAEGVAAYFGCDARDIRFSGGQVSDGAGREISFDEAAQRCYEARISLSSTGFYKTPKVAWDRIAGRGRPFYYFAYGAAMSEVAVDTLTGEYRILRSDIIHDVGASLNPAIDAGQIEGGFVQGAGWLTSEELVWDGDGRLRTHAPSTYKIPACGDRPDVFNVDLWSEGRNREDTIYRSKAVGEPPFMLGISVLMALSDAVAACGTDYPDLQAPATPERVLAAVNKVRRG
ncbi:xanthine dehydrogenase molybdopterin binding subunit [Rhodovulum sp. FJ3]|uniref:xanthine dehydrogenase molybdopterin binding subunit n=1 Tax=Rhodovulum sp. FJ3 TaxID=3079053 RepID=UPI00293DA6DB|nr:xanthine dehydrogenase molybdopterin binding subunit [Rhodovulum sp. FJ3]MDV4167309.1 xanthine dehydrogenase molybdopterin binding subunit [Rhodovulum sp. FJ3]